jgi:ABC-type transport system substrate-binding protein
LTKLATSSDEVLIKFITDASSNWGRFSDPEVDKLFELQKVERDEQKRIQLVKDLQRKVIQKAWWIPGLYWTPHHSHWMNRRLEDVWLAQQ